MELEASRRILQSFLEYVIRYRDGAWESHVRSRRIDAALRHVSHDGRNQCIPQRSRNLLRQGFDTNIVLAECHIWPALLRSADGNDDCRLARLNQVAKFCPG